MCLLSKFPSPRGVELHKPPSAKYGYNLLFGFKFPSPRGVELHKPHEVFYSYKSEICIVSVPLAGLSCINPMSVVWLAINLFQVSVPSRG